MFPMRFSTIFKSRWMALLWAVGILWTAYDFAGTPPEDAGNGQTAATDITGTSITNEDAASLKKAIDGM